MAIADGFILIGWMVVAYLLLMLFLRPGKISFKDSEENAMNRTEFLSHPGNRRAGRAVRASLNMPPTCGISR